MRHARSRGTSLVEFALVAPAFFGLTLGCVQLAVWCLGVLLANVAAQEAAGTAARSYLAQYRGDSWEQACGGTYETAAELGGVSRGDAITRWLVVTSLHEPTVVLHVGDSCEAGNRDVSDRTIRVTVTVYMRRVVPLVPELPAYTAVALTRTTRFYSF